MKKQTEKTNLLGNVSVPKALLIMGIPTMAGMLINALYSLADAYFVSGLGEIQMGAISVVYPLGQIMVGLGLLFGNGAASCISRALGRGDTDKANKIAVTALYISLSAGIIVIIFSIISLKPILTILGATKNILPYAYTYSEIYIVSCIFNVFNVTMNNIATSEGSAKTTMCALLSGAALNIILDPVFIYKFNLGVQGAAAATAISQSVSTVIYLIYIFNKKSVLNFSVKNISLSANTISEIIKIGIPTLVFQLLTSLSITLTNNAAGSYGDSAITAMGAVTRIISMGSLTVFGFIKGFQPIAGYSYGAKNFNRLHNSIKISILWSTLFCIVFGLLIILFSETIILQFIKNDTDIIHIGALSLKAHGITFMLFGFYTVYSSLFIALGKAWEGLILGSCRQGICFIPVIIVMPHLWGLNGILYAQPIADILSMIVAILMAANLHKKLNNIQ